MSVEFLCCVIVLAESMLLLALPVRVHTLPQTQIDTDRHRQTRHTHTHTHTPHTHTHLLPMRVCYRAGDQDDGQVVPANAFA